MGFRTAAVPFVLALLFLLALASSDSAFEPRNAEIEAARLQDLEARDLEQTLEDNRKRKKRIDGLMGDIDDLMQYFHEREVYLNESGPYYQYVFDLYAQKFHFPNMTAMMADAQNTHALGEFEWGDMIWTDFENLEDRELRIHIASSVMSGIGFLTGSYYKRTYDIPAFSWPWSKWTYTEKYLLVHGRKTLSQMTSSMMSDVWTARSLNDVIPDTTWRMWFKKSFWSWAGFPYETDGHMGVVTSIKWWEEGNPSFAATVRAEARALRRGVWVGRVFDLAGIVVELAYWVALAVSAQKDKEHFRDIINDNVPVRFVLKKLALQVHVWDVADDQIRDTVASWVALQESADSGSECFHSLTAQLMEQLQSISFEAFESVKEVTDEYVWDELDKRDNARVDQGDWRSDDPGLEEILTIISSDEWQSTDGEDEPDWASDFEDFDYSASTEQTPLPLEKVNATNVNYVEMQGEKGALWRLTATAWSFQEGSTINEEDEEGEEPLKDTTRGVRHRLQELYRTDTEVVLQVNHTDTIGTIPESARYNVVIDMSAGTLKNSSDSTKNLAIDQTTWSNMAPVNGWNVYYVPSTDDSLGWWEAMEECNRIKGWQAVEGSSVEPGLVEFYRNKTFIKGSAIRASSGRKTDPAFHIDLAKNTVDLIYDWDDEDIESGTLNATALEPRIFIAG
ncbi:hypothetical protein MKZ38_008100 [Zalerion maritima]|uniref:Uncharacterized protein n=1 Tax=Zalerion maritima TaxID=339359 RepID=A0AAD5RW51_9PEZI|nr:hypothetical protein MKZ38_008100 [Zalerion maritima]